MIKKHENFEAFSKVHTEVNHFSCHIFDARWELCESGYVFHVRADRFLRGMVRTIVGTLLDIGLEKTSIEGLKNILESNDRRQAGRSVSADGLYFVAAEYPEDVFVS